MFDQPTTPAGAGSAPTPRPGGPELEDIFESVEAAPVTPAAPISRPPRPTMGTPLTSLPTPPSRSTIPPPSRLTPPSPAAPTPPLPPAALSRPSAGLGLRLVLIIGGVVVGSGVLAAGGWLAYRSLTKPAAVNTNTPATTNQATPPTGNRQTPTNQPANTTPPVNLNVNTSVNAITPPSFISNTNVPAAPRDSDRDGLNDDEERLYNTNVFKVDTDDDGLTDRDEVVVFKTDPNNPDSDGDSYLDGEEVRNGYDPKGPGRLLQIPQ